jgi:hypothetical protein
MKKLLVLGIAAAALAAAGTAQAAVGLGLRGESGLARTPMAVALPPMTLAVAADFVASDDLYLPIRAEFGVIQGLELGGHYWYLDIPGDSSGYGLNVKYVFPEYVEKLGLAVGGHWKKQEIGDINNDGHDVYFVASYPAGFLVPSAGFMYESITGDNDESDFRLFGSLVANILPTFSLGAEIMTSSDKLDQVYGEEFDADPAMWFGARFVPMPGLTVQAGMLNYADFGNSDPDAMNDFVFHIGLQYEYSFQR